MPLSPIARSRIKIARARAHELVGSQKYLYPGLNDLDRLVEPYLEPFPYGTFLEIGANDGYSQSNTYHLERSGRWRGILIEPLPALFALCKRHRTGSACYNVACVGPGGTATIELVDRGLMSVAPDMVDAEERDDRIGSTTDVVTARTMTLSAIIDHSGLGGVNFMSVDVEGAEAQVLAGLDLERHRPDVLLIETEHPDEVDSILAGHLRRVAQLTFHDYVYLPA